MNISNENIKLSFHHFQEFLEYISKQCHYLYSHSSLFLLVWLSLSFIIQNTVYFLCCVCLSVFFILFVYETVRYLYFSHVKFVLKGREGETYWLDSSELSLFACSFSWLFASLFSLFSITTFTVFMCYIIHRVTPLLPLHWMTVKQNKQTNKKNYKGNTQNLLLKAVGSQPDWAVSMRHRRFLYLDF